MTCPSSDQPLATACGHMTRREGLKFTAASTVASLLLACSPAATPAPSLSTQTPQEQAMPDNTAIRLFQVSFPETDVIELRRRINMTRWPEHELVSDAASRRIWSTPAAVGPTQGVQLATMRKLIQYWGDGLRLEQVRDAFEVAAALHDADRWS